MPTDKIFRTLPFGDFYYFGKILCSTFPRQKTHNRILIMEPHTHISQPTWRHFILLFPLYLLVRLWQATIRMRASDAKSLENLEDKKRLIGLAWHNRIFFLPMCKYIFRPNFPMSGLVSASRDGAWLCAFFKFLGIGTVRGSSKRRGAHAIISMVETLQHTSDIFITPDGPAARGTFASQVSCRSPKAAARAYSCYGLHLLLSGLSMRLGTSLSCQNHFPA